MPAEVKRIYSGHVDFSGLLREFSIPIIDSDQRSLVDIELTFYTLPTLAPLVERFSLTGGQDFRFYLNEYDVTNALKHELSELIAAIPGNAVKEAYLSGALAYLSFIRSFGTHDAEIADDEEFARSYAETEDWPSKFTSLGDLQVGWSGNLHPISFIYRFIPIRPVSMADVWARHRESVGGGLPTSLNDFSQIAITISQGPAPSFEPFDPSAYTPAGRLVYQLECAYRNPLEPRLRELASRLRNLSELLENMRVNYLDPLKSDIETVEEEVTQNSNATRESIERLRETVSNISGP